MEADRVRVVEAASVRVKVKASATRSQAREG